MKKQSLSERILAYYKARPGQWIASGDIQRLVTEKTTYTASNATRRLRELAEDSLLEVEYRKGHAFYRAVNTGPQMKRKVVIRDGRAIEIVVPVA